MIHARSNHVDYESIRNSSAHTIPSRVGIEFLGLNTNSARFDHTTRTSNHDYDSSDTCPSFLDAYFLDSAGIENNSSVGVCVSFPIVSFNFSLPVHLRYHLPVLSGSSLELLQQCSLGIDSIYNSLLKISGAPPAGFSHCERIYFNAPSQVFTRFVSEEDDHSSSDRNLLEGRNMLFFDVSKLGGEGNYNVYHNMTKSRPRYSSTVLLDTLGIAGKQLHGDLKTSRSVMLAIPVGTMDDYCNVMIATFTVVYATTLLLVLMIMCPRPRL